MQRTDTSAPRTESEPPRTDAPSQRADTRPGRAESGGRASKRELLAELDARAVSVATEQFERALTEIPGELTDEQRDALAELAVSVAFATLDPVRRRLQRNTGQSIDRRQIAALVLDRER